jgi:hypothetical protein
MSNKRTKPIKKSPRYDFSPIVVRIESRSSRPIKARLFDMASSSPMISIQTQHPQIPYPVLCSMLERIQLSVNRTFLELIRADQNQFQEELHIKAGKTHDDINVIGFADGIKRQAEGEIATNTSFYKIGGIHQLLPEIMIAPKSIIELKFFVPEGGAVTGKPVKATA